jgi:hypothetical protein
VSGKPSLLATGAQCLRGHGPGLFQCPENSLDSELKGVVVTVGAEHAALAQYSSWWRSKISFFVYYVSSESYILSDDSQ